MAKSKAAAEPARWHFEQDARTGEWTWRHTLRNGTVEHMSTPYPQFAEAFLDAMRFGFNPAVHAYTAGNDQHTTHYPPARRASIERRESW
jgi:hypothetical protein